MSQPWRRLLQFARVLFVIALTLVPFALEAHHHPVSSGGTPVSCPLCAVLHHTPAAMPPAQFCLAPLLQPLSLPVSRVAPPAHTFRLVTAGRAPPTCSPLS